MTAYDIFVPIGERRIDDAADWLAAQGLIYPLNYGMRVASDGKGLHFTLWDEKIAVMFKLMWGGK